MTLAFRFFLSCFLFAGTSMYSQLSFSEQNIDLGNIPEAYEIKGDLIIKNTSNKKVFLMRADAEQGVKVHTSKRTLQPEDTCLLVISFVPEEKGKFSKKIDLVSSDQAKPYQVNLSGVLQKLNTNNKMACYYFGRQKNNPVDIKEEPLVVTDTNKHRDVSNKIPGSSPIAKSEPKSKPAYNDQKVKPKEDHNTASQLPEDQYKPNNILFLVDVSSSMRDSLKLPVLKSALNTLIQSMRDIDSLTFVTYADTIKVINEAIPGTGKEELSGTVGALKAKGMTKGRKAILFSQALAQKHFIEGGNNQIIILTDGKFRFEKDDYSLWLSRQKNKEIVMTTVAFGDDKEALRNLKEIARKGKGSFIHIRKETGYEQKLLEEVKERSRIASR